eukprot:10020323-Heterocapsa_arctica.AAC.1
MVKRAQRSSAPAHRKSVPPIDMEHLEFLLCNYVGVVGMVMAFDMVDYKLMYKTNGVKGGAL